MATSADNQTRKKKDARRISKSVDATYACQLQNLRSKVFQDCSDIDGRLGADTHLVLGVGLEETLDTTARELEDDTISHGMTRGWMTQVARQDF